MSPPVDAKDALEGPCSEDSCDWFKWDDLHACPDCTQAFCESHLGHADHGCVEVEA